MNFLSVFTCLTLKFKHFKWFYKISLLEVANKFESKVAYQLSPVVNEPFNFNHSVNHSITARGGPSPIFSSLSRARASKVEPELWIFYIRA